MHLSSEILHDVCAYAPMSVLVNLLSFVDDPMDRNLWLRILSTKNIYTSQWRNFNLDELQETYRSISDDYGAAIAFINEKPILQIPVLNFIGDNNLIYALTVENTVYCIINNETPNPTLERVNFSEPIYKIRCGGMNGEVLAIGYSKVYVLQNTTIIEIGPNEANDYIFGKNGLDIIPIITSNNHPTKHNYNISALKNIILDGASRTQAIIGNLSNLTQRTAHQNSMILFKYVPATTLDKIIYETSGFRIRDPFMIRLDEDKNYTIGGYDADQVKDILSEIENYVYFGDDIL